VAVLEQEPVDFPCLASKSIFKFCLIVRVQ
jgi:hypothetical protein